MSWVILIISGMLEAVASSWSATSDAASALSFTFNLTVR